MKGLLLVDHGHEQDDNDGSWWIGLHLDIREEGLIGSVTAYNFTNCTDCL